MCDASLTDWLQAAGGIGGVVAAVILALLAFKQMRASRQQADSTADQVTQMRADAEEERQHRERENARQAEEQANRERAVRDQIAALAGITEATRDAARAQLQPIVFTHGYGAAAVGPNDELDVGEGEIAFPYYLANEGTGPALNVKHGVEVGGTDYSFGDGMELRTLRPGESAPPRDAATGKLVVVRPFTVVVRERCAPGAVANADADVLGALRKRLRGGLRNTQPKRPSAVRGLHAGHRHHLGVKRRRDLTVPP